jgi:MFS family permease
VARAVALLTTCALPGFVTGSVVLEIREDFPLGPGALGIAFSTFWGMAALSSALAGRIAEWIGPAWAMRLAGGIAATSSAAIAAWADSALSLTLLLAVGGTAISCATPAANALLLAGVPERRRALAFGIAQSSLPGGLLLAGLAVPAVAEPLGWRVVFVVAAGLALLAAAAAPSPARTSASDPATPAGGRRPSLGWLAALSGAITLATGAVGAMNSFLVAAAPDVGLSGADAALVLALGSALSIVTRLVAGARADSGRGDALRTVAAMMAVGAAGFALVSTGSAVLFVVGSLLVLTVGWGWMGLFAFSILRRYRAAPERATGIMQTGFFAGGVVGPGVFGLLVDLGGFGPAWLGAGAGALVAAVVVWTGCGLLAPEPPTREAPA